MPRIPRLAIAGALGAALSGCGGAYTAGWLPDAHDLDRWVYGVAVDCRLEAEGSTPVRGELIAATPDSIFILTDASLFGANRRQLRELHTRGDSGGRLHTPQVSEYSKQSTWEREWKRLPQFARYPGGIPDSLDRATLRLPPLRIVSE